MKKFALGLLVAFIAFYCGVFAVKIFLVKYEFVSVPTVEAVKIKEVRTAKTENLEQSKVNFAFENTDYGEIYGWYSVKNYSKMPEVNTIKL